MYFVACLVFVYESWYLCADSEAKLKSSESNSQSSYNPLLAPPFDWFSFLNINSCMHSAHGLPYSREHAQMAAHSASWLSASVKQMVINPLSFACFRDPSPLSRGAQFGGILSRDQAHLCRILGPTRTARPSWMLAGWRKGTLDSSSSSSYLPSRRCQGQNHWQNPTQVRKTKHIPTLLDVLRSPGARLLQVLEPGVSVESRVSAAAARSSSISVARKVWNLQQ